MDEDFSTIRKMKKGDEQAVEAFVRKYYPDILKYCRLHLLGTGYEEDAAQETFEKFFRNLQNYQHYGKAKNYLYVIAGNLCKNFYARKQELPIEDAGEPSAEPIKKAEQRLELEEAVKKLDPKLREAVFLYYYQDLKLREIAKVCQIGLPLVKYRLQRARAQLKELLDF